MDPDSFWHITPREMAARMEGAHRRLSAEHDGRVWHAWHVAAFTRAEKLPDLKSLLSSKSAPVEQSPAEQVIMLDQLFLAWGGDPAQLADARVNRGDIP